MTSSVELQSRLAVPRLRHIWTYGTILLTVGVTAALIVCAPSHGGRATGTLFAIVFIGSGVHVASTAWFYTVPAVREHARSHRVRYYVIPGALVAGTAVLAAAMPMARFRWFLVPYFAWQYFHYQKQNVGMSALAGASSSAGRLSTLQRRCIVSAGLAGIVALLAHPKLLGLGGLYEPRTAIFGAAAVAMSAAMVIGLASLATSKTQAREPAFVVIYTSSLLFFVPVFLFRSPFAAASSFAIAHGYQYLLIMTLVAGADHAARQRLRALGALVVIAVLGGWLLYHGQTVRTVDAVGRAIFGAYLGFVMAHFVLDADLWRLRSEFQRRFLGDRLPYLLKATR
ncbi:MAG TPA: hypothetical protein VHV78_17390 [Gemmatimonadaceae bacterium]|nr:hypothetical protein [Gemmatimonadaceae bacterium]